ncbi:family 43 glycosylhydrolase [Fodinicola acaciae]|uniref:family 43 glycosylhydrolase n=1 Tax=Fodinicola acaciae TaxID=2681555 RepID=UPI0013D7644E|nr:family 43 glycosylhydrolase [Fodinicola acaciae]
MSLSAVRGRAFLAALAVAVATPMATLTAAASVTAAPAAGSYQNAVTDGYSIDFPDPAVMRGKDGKYYAYSTGGPYDQQGAASDPVKMASSTDLTHWTKLGAPFVVGKNWPSWVATTSGIWAPDIRYINGKYVLYFVGPDTTASSEGFDPAIGVATADSPAGPWKDAGAPLIPARKNTGAGWETVIDPAQFTDSDGTRYMYWGSYGSGIWLVQLSPDGLHSVTAPRQVATSRFEGGYVIKRDGWYYLMASSANCCAGPTTGYTVFAGRSKSPWGPFLDRDGVSMADSRAGGTIVIAQNGNRWVGVGHNSIVTDRTGQQWMTYHGVDRYKPYLQVSPGFTMRPMLLDRLDWIGGWPIVRGGEGPSDSPQPAPVVTSPLLDQRFDGNTDGFKTLSGSLTAQGPDTKSDSGGYAAVNGVAVSAKPAPADVRVEADVRGDTPGVTARYADAKNNVVVLADGKTRQLNVVVTTNGRATTTSAPVANSIDMSKWHKLVVEVRGSQLSATYSDADLGDPSALLNVKLPAKLHGGDAGVTGVGDVDNASVAPLYVPHTSLVRPPTPGSLVFSDNFTSNLGPGWTWKRQDANAHVADGSLRWPTESADLTGDTAGKTGLLLRAAPTGTYTIETKLTIDLGTDTTREFQQAGLLVYNADNDFLRLDHVATGPNRITEFGKRVMVGNISSWGGAVLGPPATTTYFRIRHTVAANGENLYQGASSRDGRNWTWGATWTMPAGTTPQIGLVSQGSTPTAEATYGKALAQFDYFRVYRG